MHSRARFALALASLLLALASLFGCKKDPPSSDAKFTTLGSSTSPVRDAFDRDVGSVRVLMLVSPS
jgi:hypothetical protein